MRRQTLLAMLIILGAFTLAGCSVSTSLVPAMSEEDGRFGFDTQVRQPFYSEADGLHKLTIRFYPEGFPGSQVPVDASQGSAIVLDTPRTRIRDSQSPPFMSGLNIRNGCRSSSKMCATSRRSAVHIRTSMESNFGWRRSEQT
ncbi:MAG: hypothetical protein EA415_12050 [Sphaerobacteraceae bacterium]|nr:MAG: hypothetical protein EA415_12050 [Sphaerobacteraceae bacterium]